MSKSLQNLPAQVLCYDPSVFDFEEMLDQVPSQEGRQPFCNKWQQWAYAKEYPGLVILRIGLLSTGQHHQSGNNRAASPYLPGESRAADMISSF